jgi:hypothetical protein
VNYHATCITRLFPRTEVPVPYLGRRVYWPSIAKHVHDYIRTCQDGPRAGLFGPRLRILRCIEWKTLFCRKQSWGEFLGLDPLEHSHVRFPSALPRATSYCTRKTPSLTWEIVPAIYQSIICRFEPWSAPMRAGLV